MKSLLALLLLPVALLAATPPAPAKPREPTLHYLVVLDTSFSMVRLKDEIYQWIYDLVSSGFEGRAQPNEAYSFWTFNERIYPQYFTPKIWDPQLNRLLALDALRFVKAQRFEKQTFLPPLIEELKRYLTTQPNLVVFLISDGKERMQGTPFDQSITAAYIDVVPRLGRVKQPVLTTLVARKGQFVAWSLSQAGSPLQFPDLSFLEEATTNLASTATSPSPPSVATAQSTPATPPKPDLSTTPPAPILPPPSTDTITAMRPPAKDSTVTTPPLVTTETVAPVPPVPLPTVPAPPTTPTESKPTATTPGPESTTPSPTPVPTPITPAPTQEPASPPPTPPDSTPKSKSELEPNHHSPGEPPPPTAMAPEPSRATPPATATNVIDATEPVPQAQPALVLPAQGRTGAHGLIITGVAFLSAAVVLLILYSRNRHAPRPPSLITQSLDRKP